MTFFTSDTHFCHKLMAELRHFDSTEDMNEHIIQSWNAKVGKKDLTYHLGDFGFKHDSLAHIRNRLNGKIILILGNHDLKNRIQHKPIWTATYSIKSIKMEECYVAMCHYPIRCWDRSHYNSYHLYGHVHSGLKFPNHEIWGKSFDIGWDLWKRPVEWSEVKAYFDTLPDNPNLLKKDK